MAQVIELYAQPAYNYTSHKVEYVEVLIREYRGIKGAESIINFVCKSGIEEIFDIDVLHATLKEVSKYKLDYPVGINLLSKTLMQENVADRIISVIHKYKIPSDRIILEINERTKFNNEIVIANLDKIREEGIKIALDDFGVEKSNLSLFLNHKVDILKIDRVFVEKADKTTEETQLKLLEIIYSLIDEFKLDHIVEGVETESQFNALKSLGYNRMQGYLYKKPMPFHQYLIDNGEYIEESGKV